MKTIAAAITAAMVSAAIIFSIVSNAKEMIVSAQKSQEEAIAVIEGQQDKGGTQ